MLGQVVTVHASCRVGQAGPMQVDAQLGSLSILNKPISLKHPLPRAGPPRGAKGYGKSNGACPCVLGNQLISLFAYCCRSPSY